MGGYLNAAIIALPITDPQTLGVFTGSFWVNFTGGRVVEFLKKFNQCYLRNNPKVEFLHFHLSIILDLDSPRD